MLNPVSATALFAALTSLSAAACVLPLGRVPDWDDLRPLFWVAVTAALMTGANVFDTLDVPAQVHVWSDRVQAAAMMLHVSAWISYLPGWTRRPEPLPWWTKAPVLLAVASLVPGVIFSDALVARPLPWLGVVYQDPVLTPSGLVLAAVVGAAGVGGLVLMARWGRAGAPYPRAHLFALGACYLIFVHDVVVLAGVPLPTPYLQDLGCFAMMIVFGVITLRRISDNASEYHRLRGSLESAVADRTRRLEESQAALARAERLAALGQFSTGVANEVNPPASAVAANLQLLDAELSTDPRDEVRRALAQAREGVQRILVLARQLLLAGRSSSPAQPLAPVNLAEALEPALHHVRARAGERAVLSVSVPGELLVSGQRGPLSQVLSHLLVNAVQAIPAVRSGTVAIRVEADAARVRVLVEDDGVGMSEEELRHVFEPFHGAKPPGQGTGLSLAVARNLVEGMHGTLRFESKVGAGTRALLELARAEAPGEVEEEGPAQTPPPDQRPLVLVIDDDAQVLRSMARLLGRRYDVVTAPGVKEALAAVEAQEFDLLLCDVMMPGGGGERFWAELLVRRPALMNRVVFMTGGAATQEARAFVRRQPRPVLIKPFEVAALDELLRGIRRTAGRRPAEATPEHTPVARILPPKR